MRLRSRHLRRLSGRVGLVAILALGTPPHLGRADESDPAIGRFNHAGYRTRTHCTMVAVAPKVVLTATHCLDGLDPTRTHLLFGYARMRYAAHRVPLSKVDLGNDLSALCLGGESPPATRAVADAPPAVGATVRLVGYGRPRAHLQTDRPCTVIGVSEADVAVACAATKGDSGGPLLDTDGRVVAVLSRGDASRQLAPRVSPSVTDACAVAPASSSREAPQ